MSETTTCPECKTDNVQSWVYDPPGKEGKYRVISCNECRKTFEERLDTGETEK